ncbi:MAG TPA: BamA/TamA family outer membrane protein [Polyangiaceae bacterium]|nr:BamA/TamA family outer membrane protein [Polyangiaceae bacterium]
MRRRWVPAVVLGLLAGSTSGLAPAAEKSDGKDGRSEFTPAPLLGGSSDVGFGGGVIASFARLRDGAEPYLYRIELVTTTMVKSEGGHVKVPYQDDYVLVSVPNLLGRRLKLEARAAYTREATQKYYGLGNASALPPGRSLDDRYFEYDRTHPTVSLDGTLLVVKPVSLELWLAYTHNWLDVPDGTLLAEDATSTNPAVRDRITTFSPHGFLTFSYGVEFDTRNDEVSPERGQFHSLRLDLSPGGTGGIPQRWGRVNAAFRGYVPLVHGETTLAVRFVADLLFGAPPFYELARYDSTGAFGGPNGVRGVPGQRYSGMVKLFGNVEVRQKLASFHFLDKDNVVQVAGFVDTGRLFAGYSAHPELDGTSLGLKLGLGGGLRLVAGTSFVLRGDVAWSPDARPMGGYVAAGQAF